MISSGHLHYKKSYLNWLLHRFCLNSAHLDFVFGGLFACLAMSLSDILSHKFTVFMSSFIFVVVLDFVCQQLGKYELQPDMFLPPAQYNSIGGIELFIMVSILFLFTILTFIIGGLRSETY